MRNNESFIYSVHWLLLHRTAAPVVFELICNGPADFKFDDDVSAGCFDGWNSSWKRFGGLFTLFGGLIAPLWRAGLWRQWSLLPLFCLRVRAPHRFVLGDVVGAPAQYIFYIDTDWKNIPVWINKKDEVFRYYDSRHDCMYKCLHRHHI